MQMSFLFFLFLLLRGKGGVLGRRSGQTSRKGLGSQPCALVQNLTALQLFCIRQAACVQAALPLAQVSLTLKPKFLLPPTPGIDWGCPPPLSSLTKQGPSPPPQPQPPDSPAPS